VPTRPHERTLLPMGGWSTVRLYRSAWGGDLLVTDEVRSDAICRSEGRMDRHRLVLVLCRFR
jgi:hypothetical protein